MDQAADDKVKSFWEKRAASSDYLWRDLTELNAQFTLLHLNELGGQKVLDLGCGDGRLFERLSPLLSSESVQVDYVIPARMKLDAKYRFVKSDIRQFRTTEQFDVILIYGVANFLDAAEARALYFRCYGWLKPGGVLIVKQQCALNTDKIVDKWSDELGADYYAQYRTITHEWQLLRLAGWDALIVDPYPEDLNTWPDTKFKAFVASKTKVLGFDTFVRPEHNAQMRAQWHGFTLQSTRNKRAYIENLIHVKKILDSLDIPFYLMYGTLLGAVREGQFIAWDRDTDIAILDRYQNRLTHALGVARFAPMQLGRAERHVATLTRSLEWLDIYTFSDAGGERYEYCGGAFHAWDELRADLEEPGSIDFLGHTFQTPRHPERTLERWYGPEWRTPDPNYVPALPP